MNEARESASQAVEGCGRRTLLQFWDQDIPATVAELVESVGLVNPDMEHRLYDDSAAREFIRSEFGAETAALYRTCVLPAMRADLFRYCFLVRCGGFYVDADYRALRPVDVFTGEDDRGMLCRREKGLCNGVMYFRDAEDPLATKILESALKGIAERSSSSVWAVTGPGILRALDADSSLAPLFEGIRFIDDEELHSHFEAVGNLEYKRGDDHWTVARDKGLSIFRD